MRGRRWLGIVILLVSLGGPVAETFDWWDQALPPGNDTEASTVVVALSVGLAIAVAAIVVRWFQSFASRSSHPFGSIDHSSTRRRAAAPLSH